MQENYEHPLIAATRRVMISLDKLENSLHQARITVDRKNHDEQALTLFMRENESLKKERENLNDSLSSLTKQYEDLQKVATNIHARLDDSARRITEILEG